MRVGPSYRFPIVEMPVVIQLEKLMLGVRVWSASRGICESRHSEMPLKDCIVAFHVLMVALIVLTNE